MFFNSSEILLIHLCILSLLSGNFITISTEISFTVRAVISENFHQQNPLLLSGQKVSFRLKILMRCVQFSTITGKVIAKNWNQITSSVFQPQIQLTSVTLNPNKNNTETTESVSTTEVIGLSLPTSSSLIPGITMPLQVPTKTIRSNSDIYNEPNTSEKSTSQDICSGKTCHQFHIQNTANRPFSQIKKTQRNIPMYNPFTENINQT